MTTLYKNCTPYTKNIRAAATCYKCARSGGFGVTGIVLVVYCIVLLDILEIWEGKRRKREW